MAPPSAPPPPTPFKTKPLKVGGSEEQPEEGTLRESDPDEDDPEDSMSLAAIEAELKPKVLETFDAIADAFKRLRRLHDQDIHKKLHNELLSPAQERRYKKLKKEIIVEMKSLRLNQARIDALVEQLHEINKRLVGHEGRLMRLAEGHGVTRDDILENYQGSELDPHWLNRVSKLSTKGWKSFVARDGDRIKELRGTIHALATETGLEIGEFHEIVNMVKKGESEARRAKKEMVEANSAPRDLYREEIHRPRLAVPRPDPGRQHRSDEGRRQIRLPPRLQVLDLRDVVDPAGNHALDRRPGAHHPHSGAHDRCHQQGRAHEPADPARDRPRADARGACGKTWHAAREGAQGAEDRQGAAVAGDADRRRGDTHLGDFIEDKNAILPIDAAIQSNLRETTTRVLAFLTPREERVLRMRFGIGMNSDHTLKEVGQQFSLTRERIRQIEARALRKLKHPSQSSLLRSFLNN